MAADRTAILAWISAAAAEIVTDADDAADIAVRIDAADTLGVAAFAAETIDLVRIIGESVRDGRGFAALALPETAGETRDALALLSAIGQALAIGRVAWPSRPAARAARTRLGNAAELAYAIAARLDAGLYAWLRALMQVAIRLVSEIAANSTPMARVTTNTSLPSTALAYQLYGDATRAGQLIDTAGSATPMLMPGSFDALAG
ncbi:hypothetical protein [Mycoplana ramosa]|uniref:Acyl-CoA dehydrogenase n=1 Tax=Mycoplana ramosa TaxID=40837 RepID=A0ABW3YWK6_MYCRA